MTARKTGLALASFAVAVVVMLAVFATVTFADGGGASMDVLGNSQVIPNGDTTPSLGDWTDFGPASIAGGTVTRTFTVRNTGTSTLNLTGSPLVAISGAQAAEFTVTQSPAASVAASGSTTFKVRFAPTAGGTRSATVSVANDDPAKNPYTFAIQGTGTVPQIDLQGNGTTIVNGSTTPSLTNDTDFGDAVYTVGTVTRTFTIRDIGTARLNLTGSPRVALSGAHAADFNVTTQPPLYVTAGTSVTFDVQFTPGATGARTATVSIASDDATANPFTFAILGTGVTPGMDVQGKGLSITNGSTLPDVANDTDYGDVVYSVDTATHTFTVLNTGTSTLNLTGSPLVAISGANAADFEVVTSPASSIAAGGSTTFSVKFTPGATGLRGATISLANDTLGDNPYSFAVQGTGVTPEIDVQGNWTSIPNGSTTPSPTNDTDFGDAVYTVATVSHTFTVINTGTSTLNLTGSPRVAVSGANAADFEVTVMPSASVAVSGSTQFAVKFTPGATGLRSATISIANDDLTDNPFTFAIQGTGVTPEIDIKGNGISIVNGSTTPDVADDTDFGEVVYTVDTVTHTFTVLNTGTSTLNLTGSPLVAISGANAADFQVTVAPASSIAVSASTTFNVKFTPGDVGLRSATITIASNDLTDNPFTFAVQGTGVTPEIDVQGNGVSITNGSSTPSVTNDTDFGDVVYTVDTATHTFTILNTGTSTLNLTGSPLVAVGGPEASDYTVTSAPSATVAVGASTTFSVKFTPGATGARYGILTVANDSLDKSPFFFAVKGTGVTPEIDVQGKGVSITNGSTTPSVTNDTDFGDVNYSVDTVTHTFTIYNTGTSTLNLTGSPRVAISGANAADFEVTSTPAASIAVSGSTTFSVKFTPGAASVRTATVSIASDDLTSDPFTFAIKGTGITPEMEVWGKPSYQVIANGSTTPSTLNDTDCGNAIVGVQARTFTHKIYNAGSATLHLTGSPLVAISGPEASDFEVTTAPSASIAAGGGPDFVITFTPSASGVRSATVTIANDDLGDNPYTYAIQGTGITPEIEVQGNGINIPNGCTTPIVGDDTDFGDVVYTVDTATHTFTILNTGTSTLNLTGSPRVAISGPEASDFEVTAMPAVSVGPSGSTTFSVKFTPGAAGLRSATISIANNDRTDNPFTFAIQGTGVTPGIDVQGNGVSIPNGSRTPSVTDDTDFGDVVYTVDTVTHTFTILNTGTSPLHLTGSTPVDVVGASDFELTSSPATTIAVGSSTTFDIKFTPGATGVRSATVVITSDSLDPSWFSFMIQGTGVTPEIDVQGNGTSIPNGSSTPSVTNDTDFGNVVYTVDTATHTFTILNTGTSALHLTGSPLVQFAGPGAADFALTTAPSATIAVGSSTTFDVTFTPGATGARNARLRIFNDSLDDTLFAFAIKGTGVTPEIDVQGNGGSIANGSTTPSAKNDTDFGDAVYTVETVTHTFTILNTGTSTLNLTGSPLVTISGPEASDFEVTAAPAASIAVSGSATFSVKFTPGATGLRSATISIASDDLTDNPFTFAVQGTGVTPEIDVQGNGVSIVNGSTTPDVADDTDFGEVVYTVDTATHTFTVYNTGTSTLNLTGSPLVAISGPEASDFEVTAAPAASIAVSGSTTFSVKFTPGAAGLRSATISIANDDLTDNPFTFAVQGTGTTPEIDVQGNGISIANGSTTPDVADDTDFGDVVYTVDTATHTFTVLNTGTSTLHLTGSPLVAVSGANAADFEVTVAPATSIAVSGSTSFSVKFTPGDVGLRSATITIASDDLTDNPFTFAIQGTGVTPKIEAQGKGEDIPNGSTPSLLNDTDFGDVVYTVGTATHTFTVLNTGASALHLTGSSPVQIFGSSDFEVTSAPATTIAVGSSTTFDIKFTPGATGVSSASVLIVNDSLDMPSFSFGIKGTGTDPLIEVQGNDITITNGSSTPSLADGTDLGDAEVGGADVTQTFVIKNTGTGWLHLTGSPTVAISGPAAGDFSVTATPDAAVDGGEQTSFDITFAPTAGGLRSATVTIANDDRGENPFVFAIQGVSTAPIIDLLGNDVVIPNGSTTPDVADDTDFGEAIVASGSVTHVFTIRNTGDGTLYLKGSPRVALSGPDASEFAVLAQPDSYVVANSSATFQVKFTPTGAGVKTATVTIINGDPTRTPYTYVIEGTGVTPEIDVQGNGVSITNGSSTPSLLDDTDFGNAVYTVGTVTHTFTVLNTGTSTLNLTGSPLVAVSGANAADFVVTSAPSASIAAGGSTTFDVKFTPGATGLRSATITIASNDLTDNPFTYAIQGTGVTPEMDVLGKGVSIPNGSTTPSATDDTDFGKANYTVDTVTRTFTVRNTGTSTLNLTGSPLVALSGANAADFEVTTSPASTVAAGGSATFSIKFTPGAASARTATVSVANDDLSENPYTFAIKGTGITPEIEVRGKNVVIVNGSTTPSTANDTDFGNAVYTVGTVTRTFTVRNLGSAKLILTGSPLVALSGPNAADFSVTVAPASTIASPGSTTFNVMFTPGATGARNATVSIASNDVTDNPFTFAIKGTGITPEIDVRGKGVSIPNGSTTPTVANGTDFAKATYTVDTVTNTFTVVNTGTSTLNLTGSPRVAVSGTNAGDFSVTTVPAASVAAGASTTFKVTFTPGGVGTRTATVSIANDDLDENPYTFAVKGTGITPQMEVRGKNVVIANGSSTPSVANDTDFGNAVYTVDTVTHTFTVRNTGSAKLFLTGSPLVAISGTNAADFSVTANPASTIASPGSTTFNVMFTPGAVGLRSATVSIANTDLTDNPYVFAVQGTGMPPMMEVQGYGVDIVNGSTTPDWVNGTDFGFASIGRPPITNTFTVLSTGTSTLHLTGSPLVQITGAGAADFTVTVTPASSVAGGGSTTFNVQFAPSVVGVRTATVSIANDTVIDNPYVFAIKGTGVGPAIDVQGNGVSIVNGSATPSVTDDTEFGSVALPSGSVQHIFTIRAVAGATLHLTGSPLVAVSGANAADFVVTAQPSSTVAAGSSTTFTVRFSPSAAGLRSATVSIASDDTANNPFTFAVQGTGYAEAVMSVKGKGVLIANGSATPSVTNDTSYGTQTLGGSAVTHVFTVLNTGTAVLNLTGSPIVAVSGAGAADFAVTANPAASVATGGSTTFSVDFTPSVIGVRNATISIANNDPSDNPYVFAVQGTTVPAALYVNDDSTVGDIFCTAVGNDANDGLTPGTPMRHIQALLTRYSGFASLTAKIDTGTYAENVTIGSAYSGWKLQGAGIRKTIIDGGLTNSCLMLTGVTSGEISYMTLKNGKATGSTAPNGFGGGIRCLSGTGMTLSAIEITACTANYGGAVYSNSSNPALVNCLIWANKTVTLQGVVMASGSKNPSVVNCTIAYNLTNSGGIRAGSPCVPVIKNTILWGNGDELYNCAATYSCIEDGDAGTGNISANPSFVNSGAGDFELNSGSPCINAGTSAGAPTTDIEGNPRDATPDMGAYEHTSGG